jgi:hypothetical protein
MRDRTIILTDERGVALPMAMLALLILSALVVGFSVLSATEPTIANNQIMVAQARSLAEAGVERVIWALNNPGDANGIPGTGAIPAPYDGSQLILVSAGGNNLGGFRVTVAAATTTPYPADCPPASSLSRADRCIVAVGWVPNDTTSSPTAHQKIRIIATNPQLLFTDPPAALSVRGDLQMGGNSLVDSRTDTSCGRKVGTVTTGDTDILDTATDVWGAADNNDVRNEVTDANNGPIPADAHDIVKDLGRSYFDRFALTDADINALRTYAKRYGTYLQGTVSFNASNLIPNGLVFIDTVSGNNITREGVSPATPIYDFASVSIQGNPPADPSGIFSGYLFVNGTLTIDGNFMMHGLAYTQNDIDYHGVGTGGVWGAMISRNIRDVVQTSIDSDVNGNALVNYNCQYAKTAGGTFSSTWTITSGTYRELCDSCT